MLEGLRIIAARVRYALANPNPEELMHGQDRLFGAVEAGGTKFVCAIADESGSILAESRFPTADPDSTLASVRDFFKVAHGDLAPARTGRGLLRPRHSGSARR